MPFVYLIKAHNDDGDSSIVLAHTRTIQEAEKIVRTADRIGVPNIGFEGPVDAAYYPIGHTINEEESDDDS